ncbi:MAG TPA: host attachment protein [Kofleriaceae bacterium]|nr:host attachment protein [Kofleriaceae bacterium]
MPIAHACLVVADAARARLYTFQRQEDVASDLPDLQERADLVNPERRQRPSEVHSDTRPGSSRAPTGASFTVDDHRDAHQEAVDRKFAEAIHAELTRLLAETGYRHAIVVASHRMLGHLRASGAPPGDVELHELALDLTKETTPQLQDRLSTMGLLPPRRRAGFPE